MDPTDPNKSAFLVETLNTHLASELRVLFFLEWGRRMRFERIPMMDDTRRPVLLSDLVARLASRCFGFLNKVLYSNPGSEGQKIELMKILHMIYVSASKVLILIRYNRKFPNSESVVRYTKFAHQLDEAWGVFSYDWFMFTTSLPRDEIEPMYDICNAIDILTGSYPTRLPLSIFPKQLKPRFNQSSEFYFHLIEDDVRAQLASLTVPSAITCSFVNGTALIKSKDRYTLHVTVSENNGPLVISGLDINLPGFYVIKPGQIPHILRRKYFLITQQTIQAMIQRLQVVLTNGRGSGMLKVDAAMDRMCNIFLFQKMVADAKEMERLGLIRVNARFGRQSYFVVPFWDTTLAVILQKNSIVAYIGVRNIGDADSLSFDELLSKAKRLYALQKLKEENQVFNGELIDDPVPKIRVHGIEICHDRVFGQQVIDGDARLTEMMKDVDKLLMRIRVDEEVQQRSNAPIILIKQP